MKIREDLIGQTCPQMSYIFKSFDGNYMENITYSIDYWSRKLKPNVTDAFTYCETHNYEKDCLSLISESFTAYGLCYTINRLSFQDLYRDDV